MLCFPGGHTPSPLRWIARALVLMTVVAGMALAVPAQPAQAHAQLLSSSPANGERLATAPSEVTLTFSEGASPVEGACDSTARGGTSNSVVPATTRPRPTRSSYRCPAR